MYYAIGMNKMLCEFINENDEVLKTVMNLMNHQLHDKARFLLAKENRNFCQIKIDDNNFNLESGIGDWMYLFRNISGIKVHKKVHCRKCKKQFQKENMINSINADVIRDDLQSKLKHEEKRVNKKFVALKMNI